MKVAISDRQAIALLRWLDAPATRAVDELRAAFGPVAGPIDAQVLSAERQERELSFAAVEILVGVLRGPQAADSAQLSLEALKALGA